MAALLSFLWPGLGQLYRGRRSSAVIFGLPMAVLLLGLAVLVAEGAEVFALRLLSPPVALTAFGVSVLVAIWRVAAIAGAARNGDRLLGFGSRSRLGLSLLLIGVVVTSHAAAALMAWSFFRAGSAIFQELPPASAFVPLSSPSTPPGELSDRGPTPTPVSAAIDATPRPTAKPLDIPTDPPPPAPSWPSASQAGGERPTRVNVLLVGLDTGSGGNNTDTLLVASFDRANNSIVMLSIPRDTAMFPLYDGRTYTAKVNSLMSHAAHDPAHFPDGGMAALVRQMEFLVGIDIHYYASIDIAGFRRLIELAGGVEVTVEQRLSDPTYKLGLGPEGFQLEPGEQHLDSWQALAYVRSRKGAGGSDFERARRQQQLLLALRRKIDDPHLLAALPGLLDATAETVRTDMPVEFLPQLLELLQGSLDAETESIVLGPPTYSSRIPPAQVGGLYALQLDIEEVAKLSRRLFGDDSHYNR